MTPEPLFEDRTTTFLPHQEASLRKALGLLNMIAAGEIAGEEAAKAAREAMDEVDAIPVNATVYSGRIAEWDETREAVDYPVVVEREGPTGALRIMFGESENPYAASMQLLLEVNVGRPCLHFWPEVASEDSLLTVFADAPKAGEAGAFVRIDGRLSEHGIANWRDTSWTVQRLSPKR